MMSGVAVLLFLLANSLPVSLAGQECTSSGDCPQEKVCAANLCEDPCPGFCGENTACQVKWHTPICRCRQGYNGDPIEGCTKSAINECSFNGDCSLDKSCENHKCEDPCLGFCGNNTACQVKRHTPVCSCLQGFIGEPMLGCTESAVPGQCHRNSECDQDRACDAGQCHNPCHNVCGNNTVCRVTKHVPVCSCNEGFTGDPMEGCTGQVNTSGSTTNITGKKQFKVSTVKVNFTEAFKNCHKQGMRLATIENKEQNDDLVADMAALDLPRIAPLNHVWIGAIDLNGNGEKGDWYWITTKESIMKYMNWVGTGPSKDDGRHCMVYWKNKDDIGWGSYPCSSDGLAACEYY